MRVDKIRNQHGEVWLNVASSDQFLPGFVNLDNSPFLRLLPFYRVLRPILPDKYRTMFGRYKNAASQAQFIPRDCRKPIPLPDSSVDHILCSHFIEHVKATEAKMIIADFFRVMKEGASLHLIVPDLLTAAEIYVAKRDDPEAADQFQRDLILHFETRDSFRLRLLQFMGGFGLTHQWMYDAESLRQRLLDVGFEVVDKDVSPSENFRKGDGSLHIVAVKTQTEHGGPTMSHAASAGAWRGLRYR